MNIKIEKKDGIDVVVYADGPPGWARPASADEVALWTRITDLEKALGDLHALVWGECPSLLNEDSGGSGELDVRIRSLMER